MSNMLCPDDRLVRVTAEIAGAADGGAREIEDLLVRFPADPRLHFLRGSLLAASQRYDAGKASFQKALDIDPGYAIARFQLGLLQLTMADAASAASTWAPLAALPITNPLRLFAAGLQALARDQFSEAITALAQGIEHNDANAPLNANMQFVIDQIKSRDQKLPEINAVHWLLRQYGEKPTQH